MGITLILIITITIFYGKEKIGEEKFHQQMNEYKGIINLWNIDTFEGGTGSRKQFLERVATEFERRNKGTLIMVTDHTKFSAEENMKKGIYPDMISYGIGINTDNMTKINIDKVYKGGRLRDETYGVAWVKGGYVLIGNKNLTDNLNTENESVIVSQSAYTQPLIAMMEEEIKVKDTEVYLPKDAYDKFISGKQKYLIGTQRDIVRLANKKVEIIAKPLTKYNDLYQYISIMTESHIKKYMCEKFINYLISEKVQKSLTKLKMFSPYYKLEYEETILNNMAEIRNEKTLPIFIKAETSDEYQCIMGRYFKGETEEINKIKNMLV